MRAVYALISCLLLASSVSADDLLLGERNDDDFIVTNRFIFKPPIPNKAMMARLGVTAPENAVVTCVVVKNLAKTSTPTITLVKGDIGENALLLLATAQPGEGMLLEITGYATNVTEPTTTAAPDTPTGGTDVTGSTGGTDVTGSTGGTDVTGSTGGTGATGDVVETTTPAAPRTTGTPDVPCDTEVTTRATATPTGPAGTSTAPPASDAPTTDAPVTTADPTTTNGPTGTDVPEGTTVATSQDTE